MLIQSSDAWTKKIKMHALLTAKDKEFCCVVINP